MFRKMLQLFLATVLLSSCGSSEEPLEECQLLFGAPTANTGLGADDCTASCECGETPWTPPSYSESDITRLEALVLLNPPSLLEDDPYALPEAPELPEGFCGVVVQPDGSSYNLESYTSEEAAWSAGATITHKGNCGQCSSLKNLSVYIRNPDLTDPVRSCGVTGMLQGEEANIECLMEIGFEEACAQIWYFNTKHTREVCLDVCMSALDAPHHQPDASLNDCIQCDEDQSGPIFKAVSGRTRRNSGLPSGLCRPCNSVYPAEHLGY